MTSRRKGGEDDEEEEEEKKDTPAVQGNILSCVYYMKQINKVGKTRSANSTCCTPVQLPMFYKGLNITKFADFFFLCEFGRTAKQLEQ